MRPFISASILLAFNILLTGCENHSSNNKNTVLQERTTTLEDQNTASSEPLNVGTTPFEPSPLIKEIQVSDGKLIPKNIDDLSAHIKNGVRLNKRRRQTIVIQALEGDASFNTVQINSNPESARTTIQGNVSFTNVHEQNVGEGDISKYDGNYWYLASQTHGDRLNLAKPSVKILQTHPNSATVELMSSYDLGDWGPALDLFLVQEAEETTHIAALQGNRSDVERDSPILVRPAVNTQAFDGLLSVNGFSNPQQSHQLKVSLIDVSNAASPKNSWELVVDGELIESRKIGDVLYLITRYYPWSEALDPTSSTDIVDFDNTLKSLTIDELMPTYSINGDRKSLSSDCYVQAPQDENAAISSLVNITAIDLKSTSVKSSTCLHDNAQSIMMTEKSLYLTADVHSSQWQNTNTIIHKFNVSPNQLNYSASGIVRGTLGWRSDPAFKLSEYNNDLRLLTTTFENASPSHKLYILEENQGQLLPVATLPNSKQPEPIGKVNEDIYAVRFIKDTAYIVTFEQQDPLYAVDLSDRLSPKIKGQLTIPGFANYIYPVGDHYLFTLGHSANEFGLALGVKAELFDIAGDSPKLINTLLLSDGNGYSEATSNLHAISFQQPQNDRLRISIPISTRVISDSEIPSRNTIRTKLQLLEIRNINTSRAQLNDAGWIDTGEMDTGSTNIYGISSRSILHDDAVFFNHKNDIWAAFWQQPEAANGPLTLKPTNCQINSKPGITAIVSVPEISGVAPCDVTVIANEEGYYEPLIAQPEHEQSNQRQCVFTGIESRAGYYQVKTSHPSLAPSIHSVSVFHNECHVLETQIDVKLMTRKTCEDQSETAFQLSLFSEEQPETNAMQTDLCNAEVSALLYDFSNPQKWRSLAELEQLGSYDTFTLSPQYDAESNVCRFIAPEGQSGTFKIQVQQEGYQPVSTVFEQYSFNTCRAQPYPIDVYMHPLTQED